MASETRPELSPRERDVLEWIVKYVQKHNQSPSLGDIAGGFGYSKQWAHQKVRRLRDTGYLRPKGRWVPWQTIPVGMNAD